MVDQSFGIDKESQGNEASSSSARIIAENNSLITALSREYPEITIEILRNFAFLSEKPRRHPFEGDCIDSMIDWAKQNNARYEKDQAGNLIIDFPGKGRGVDSDPVGLQFHIDGVVASELSPEHEVTRLPLKFFTESRNGEDYLGAENSTLMADNRGAGSVMMTIATDESILNRPPIRLIVTIGEEVGLAGASKINPDWLKPLNCIINLDTECFGAITLSCAGGARLEATLPFVTEEKPGDSTSIKVSLTELPGGHSGGVIHENRPNAIKISALLCESLCKQFPSVRVIRFRGGAAMNSIPSEASFEVFIPKSEELKIREYLYQEKSRLLPSQGELSFTETNSDTDPLTSNSTKSLLNLINKIPNGVIKPGEPLPLSSSNLGLIETYERTIVLGILARASRSKQDLDELKENHEKTAEQFDAAIKIGNFYYPWSTEETAPIVTLARDAMLKCEIKEIKFRRSNGGIEPAHFANKAPETPCVSLGMDICDAHTTNERMRIGSLEPTFRVVAKLLEDLIDKKL